MVDVFGNNLEVTTALSDVFRLKRMNSEGDAPIPTAVFTPHAHAPGLRHLYSAQGGLGALQDCLQLERVVLDRNHLTGSLDPLANLQLLRELTLEHNQIDGEVQSCESESVLKSLASMHRRTHRRVNPSYPIPLGTIDAINGMEALELFWAGHNQLTGTLDPLSELE